MKHTELISAGQADAMPSDGDNLVAVGTQFIYL